MELEGDVLQFFLVYENRESVLQLSEYDTVEILKIRIHNLFGVPPHKQVINGLKNIPECDYTILKECVEEKDIIFLEITEVGNYSNINMSFNIKAKDLEIEASVSCINKLLDVYGVSSVNFRTCRLKDAINEACLAPIEQRKSLLFYLYRKDDPFSSIFCEYLKKPEIIDILNRNFILLGWDVEEIKYQGALVQALNECYTLSNLVNMVSARVSAALCILSIEDSVTVFSCLRGEVSYNDFLSTLKNTENFLIVEKQEEEALEELKKKTTSKDDMGSEKYQKLMADMLGDRDYDSFEFNQHEHLKMKIAYALLGPPKKVEGYEEEEKKDIERLYKIILESNNEIAQYKDKVEMSFIYNCTQPLPAEKLCRAKQYKEYNPNTDMRPLPIFIIRKCHGSENPCRVFIDHTGRIYDTWEEYITRNKLTKCEMVLPRSGRYEVDDNGKVLLDKILSPDCDISAQLLQGADIISTVGGVCSGIVLLGAAFTTLVAPPAVLVGGVIGAVVGLYSMGRSAYVLYDRNRHREELNFANSEARGAYLNLVAGSLGFAGAGANMAVSQLASRGVNIGTGARAVVNTIGVVNIGASGATILNSGYDIFDQWYNDNQTPSMLAIVQLSSSILFFGNAVYNFRSCSTIVEETQTRTLQDYQESLRSNRHRKTFTKLLKETIHQNNGNEVRGKAEVISAIRNIQNKDEVFAVLTRSNKKMNKLGIKFQAIDGEIRLNGKSIDVKQFMSMNKKDASTFLSNLPKSELTPIETRNMREIIFNTLQDFSLPDIETLVPYIMKLLCYCTGDIRSKILDTLASLLTSFTGSIKQTLDEIFPNHTKYLNVMDMIITFFGKKADHLEDQYQMWLKTKHHKYYNPLFEYVDPDKIKRAVKFFETAVRDCYNGVHLTEQAMKELLNDFYNWLARQVFDYQERTERSNMMRTHSATSPTEQVSCSVCGGHYYKKK